MRAKACILALAFVLTGCKLGDENPQWDPRQEYPAWAYDAPFYYRPSEDPPAAETAGEAVPIHYTNGRRYFIKHSAGYQVPGVPRLEVWFSADEGRRWERAGYFGVEQTHFLFEAEADGAYWVRFVGPGQGTAAALPGSPHRIYVVDTQPPRIALMVDPPPVTEDEHGRQVRRTYQVGQKVLLCWNASDANLAEDGARLATTFASFPDNLIWAEYPPSLPAAGNIEVPIPAEAAGADGKGAGIRFRLQARDKAGNVNVAFSDVLTVGPSPEPLPVRPVEPWQLTARRLPTPGERPGWPDRGALIRGGSSRVLSWFPPEVDKYKHVVLQFSANNGRSWRTVGEKLQVARPVKWTVPEVNSKLCQLRVMAVVGPEEKVMLAQTPPFTVHTAPPQVILGPEKLLPESSAD